jgi:hypothetical protein
MKIKCVMAISIIVVFCASVSLAQGPVYVPHEVYQPRTTWQPQTVYRPQITYERRTVYQPYVPYQPYPWQVVNPPRRYQRTTVTGLLGIPWIRVHRYTW